MLCSILPHYQLNVDTSVYHHLHCTNEEIKALSIISIKHSLFSPLYVLPDLVGAVVSLLASSKT